MRTIRSRHSSVLLVDIINRDLVLINDTCHKRSSEDTTLQMNAHY
jgi:hypothetical protein